MKLMSLLKPLRIFIILIFVLSFSRCSQKSEPMPPENAYKILFLHHSTGMTVWKGSTFKFEKIKRLFGVEYDVPAWFNAYNQSNGTDYFIREQSFPKGDPYPWNNYPYDYYNIWVKHAGERPFEEEPTLEILTAEYDMIIFKHCFPVSQILPDQGVADVESPEKRIENYKVQYAALKEKLHQFPDTKFLVWTGAANVEKKTLPERAKLARDFFEWVKGTWDTPGDNIFLWDFYELETEGGLYLKNEYARSSDNSHPNTRFTSKVAPLFCQRIVDVIETNGQNTTLTGQKLK